MKRKEKIFKATREEQQITYKGIPIQLSADFLMCLKGIAQYILSNEREKPTTKNTLPSKALIQI